MGDSSSTYIVVFYRSKVIERKNIIILSCVILLQLCNGNLFAKTMTVEQAELAVKGWLKSSSDPIYIKPDKRIINIETILNDLEEPLFFVANLAPSGFVLVSANDSIEPIIGFSDNGIYDSSIDNPLFNLVNNDITNRIEAIQKTEQFQLFDIDSETNEFKNKWSHLISIGLTSELGFELMGLSSVADVRVAPLIKSKWSQTTCCVSEPAICYNYFTPQHYPTGCVATAMAQLMRYHSYPTESINNKSFNIRIDGSLWSAYPTRGNNTSLTYDWDMMPLDPNCFTTQTQRKAIGAICYDAGVSVGTNYYSNISIADVYNIKDALKNVFNYGQAIIGYNNSKDIGNGLIDMINPNLDAGEPVILAINRPNGTHTVLCDGYGMSGSTMYHHLNMGWAGIGDAWYNLPDVNAIDRTYSSVVMCIYNIHVSDEGDGEVVSGRILDQNGKPVSDANVYAESIDKNEFHVTSTNAKGIYAFSGLKSATIYSIKPETDGYIYNEQHITTGISINERAVSGNIWALDFQADYIGDFDNDGDIDNIDYSIFASAWHSKQEDKNYNARFDISNSKDGIIDKRDLTVFMENWNANKE